MKWIMTDMKNPRYRRFHNFYLSRHYHIVIIYDMTSSFETMKIHLMRIRGTGRIYFDELATFDDLRYST